MIKPSKGTVVFDSARYLIKMGDSDGGSAHNCGPGGLKRPQEELAESRRLI